MKVVIIAGGKGTRIVSIADEIPKAMIPINGKPVLEYQLELAKRYGFTEIIIIIGYLGEQIKNYFGDGKKWALTISYYEELIPLGTAGALVEISDMLNYDFFVFYGDTIMDIALDQMLDFHLSNNADSTLLLHPNDHPYDSDLVELSEDNKIIQFYSKPHPKNLISRNLVNAALYILSPKLISLIPQGVKSDFGKDIFPKSIKNEFNIYGYISPEYIKDMGTPDRYKRVCEDIESGKVARLNKKNPRVAIFMDRDGVVVKEVNLLHKIEDIELIEGVDEAISLINDKGYLAIIVTNQPVIARGLCSIEELNFIHKKLETMLGAKHAYVDSIYYCPHHPDSGFPEENKKYKIVCDCRKPSPGMLLKAAAEWNIDIASSYMIGDRMSDIEAGERAGVNYSILINENEPNALLNAIKNII